MHENLGEQLTIEDMAKTAMFSKFHFSRVFQRATGLSPGRFLSAIRLQEAKRLLASTSLSVTEISHRVGYASVGTFSSRFRSSVGFSPTMYRRIGGFTGKTCPEPRLRVLSQPRATISGRVRPSSTGRPGMIFIGLFPDRLPHGQPVRCTALEQPGLFTLDDVPAGRWHVLVYSPAESVEKDEDLFIPAQRTSGGDLNGFVGSHGPVTIRPDTGVSFADVRLRSMTPMDPPVLLALLDERATG